MIAVTGASGHLGQWVVAELTQRGHDVLGISRRPSVTPSIAGLTWARPIRTLACDLGAAGDVEALADVMGELRVLVHLAAHVPAETAKNADADADATLRDNAFGTARLFALLARAPRLETVVYASTFEVYGAVHRTPIDESHPTEPLNYYGASKLLGEKYLRLLANDRRIATSALRFPAIYGPGDTLRRAIGNFVRAAAARGSIAIHGDGADLRELVYCSDAARAVAACIDRHASGVFNIASGTGISILRLAEAVRRVAGYDVPIETSPRQKPRADYVLDRSKAERELGWTPTTSLDDGVRAQLDWVRASSSDTSC